jgi:hypothetical protein
LLRDDWYTNRQEANSPFQVFRHYSSLALGLISNHKKTPVLLVGPGAADLLEVKKEACMESERRRSPRYRFIADAEVVEIENGTTVKARTNDLSIGGCFLDTLNPSVKGTEILVRIRHGASVFNARGRVAFVVAHLGMGVCFTNIDSDQAVVLNDWLSAVVNPI